VLRAVPRDVSDPASQEYTGSYADRPVFRVFEKGGQLAGAAVIRAPQTRFDHPHVRVDDPVGDIDPHVVVLVTVPGAVNVRLVDGLLVYICLDPFSRVTVRPVGARFEPYGLSAHKPLDDVPPAIFEGPGIDGVPRVVVRDGGSAKIYVHGGYPAIRRDVVEVALPPADLDPGFGMSEVHEHAA